ncbi:MAG TPA: protein tyrosine phosphatase [Roseiflexaceae bacterium]
MVTILLIGGADTGRAPMAAALLRRLLEQRGYGWLVGSAGVLGHDGDPAEVEARDAMAHMGLTIGDHQARSLTAELVAEAALLLALDSGTALVARAHFPDAASRIHTLGALAGRQRDIPDPFRMQIGAWITYAREIETLLETALPRIVAAMPTTDDGRRTTNDQSSEARAAAVERIERLLRTAIEMPGVIDWAAARARIEADLGEIAAVPGDTNDLIAAYIGLLRAALTMTPPVPSHEQLAALRDATGRLTGPVGQADLNDLSLRLGGWAAL